MKKKNSPDFKSKEHKALWGKLDLGRRSVTPTGTALSEPAIAALQAVYTAYQVIPA